MLFDKTARMTLMVHKSSVGGSVSAQDSGSQKEICYLSWAFPPRYRAVVCLENPRVRGSIPRLATKAFQAKTATLTGCRFCLRRTKIRVPELSRNKAHGLLKKQTGRIFRC
jgi:hypothetical protein